MSFIPENKEILSIAKVREMNPLVLAYIGDAVQSLYLRAKLATTTTAKTHKIHIKVCQEVKASSQSKKIEMLLDKLTQDEKDIFYRARNSHVNNVAKSASKSEYMAATGFEAVVGFLYLTGNEDRLNLLLEDNNE